MGALKAEALYGAFASIHSLLIVVIVLIQFGHNVPCKFWRSGPLLWENRCL